MKKFYVTLNEKQIIVLAGNQYQACIKALKSFLDPEAFESQIGLQFRLSERGFGLHDDDIYIPLQDVVMIMFLAHFPEAEFDGDFLENPLDL